MIDAPTRRRAGKTATGWRNDVARDAGVRQLDGGALGGVVPPPPSRHILVPGRTAQPGLRRLAPAVGGPASKRLVGGRRATGAQDDGRAGALIAAGSLALAPLLGFLLHVPVAAAALVSVNMVVFIPDSAPAGCLSG